MEVIVADANIFVYLYLCNLLIKFLHLDKYAIKICTAVYNEITNKKKRIAREYPELREIILNFSNNHSSSILLEQINTSNRIHDIFALQVYYELHERGELDLGEIESIPLSIELGGRFLSNDTDAIEIANRIKPGLGIAFLGFSEELLSNNIIENFELESIYKLLRDY